MQLFNLVAIGPANLISGGVIDAAGFSLSNALFATVNGAAATKPTSVDFDNLVAAFQQPSTAKLASNPLVSATTAPTSDETKSVAPPHAVNSRSLSTAVDTVSVNDVSKPDEPLQRLLVSQSKTPVTASSSATVKAAPQPTGTTTETANGESSEKVESTEPAHKPGRTRVKHSSETAGIESSNSIATVEQNVVQPLTVSDSAIAEAGHDESSEPETADIPFRTFAGVLQRESVWPQAMTLTVTPDSQQVKGHDSAATGTSFVSGNATPGNNPALGATQQLISDYPASTSLPSTPDLSPLPQPASNQLGERPIPETSVSDEAVVPVPTVNPQPAVVEDAIAVAASSFTAALPNQGEVTAQIAPVVRPVQGRVDLPHAELRAIPTLRSVDIEAATIPPAEIPLENPVEDVLNSIETAMPQTAHDRPEQTVASESMSFSETPVPNADPSQAYPAGIASVTSPMTQNVATQTSGSQHVTTLHHGTIEHLANAAVQQATLVESGGSQKFQIRLDPPHLGEVVIEISRDSDGQYDISVSAASPETHALLEQQSNDITQALTDQGLSLNGFDLSQHQQGSSEEILQQQEQAELARLRGEVVSNQSSRSGQPTSDGSVSFRA